MPSDENSFHRSTDSPRLPLWIESIEWSGQPAIGGRLRPPTRRNIEGLGNCFNCLSVETILRRLPMSMKRTTPKAMSEADDNGPIGVLPEFQISSLRESVRKLMHNVMRGMRLFFSYLSGSLTGKFPVPDFSTILFQTSGVSWRTGAPCLTKSRGKCSSCKS